MWGHVENCLYGTKKENTHVKWNTSRNWTFREVGRGSNCQPSSRNGSATRSRLRTQWGRARGRSQGRVNSSQSGRRTRRTRQEGRAETDSAHPGFHRCGDASGPDDEVRSEEVIHREYQAGTACEVRIHRSRLPEVVR